MTTELVLLLGIYAYIILGVFLGDLGPLATFKKSGPRLAARIERNISIGNKFITSDGKTTRWQAPGGP
ncbi:MAG: hypothetical protein K1X29_08375 [Bdellovibrionales bacterium]|nr:hypothetical protein [Bdellovibrionales bacterium]